MQCPNSCMVDGVIRDFRNFAGNVDLIAFQMDEPGRAGGGGVQEG